MNTLSDQLIKHTILFTNFPHVQKCLGEIEKAKGQGHSSCYCEAGKAEVMREFSKMLIARGFTVEPCSVKGVVVWENDHDPYGETLKQVTTKEALYVDWSGQYKTSYVQSAWNRVFHRQTVRMTLDWNSDTFNLFDEVNTKLHE
jgi:hypothetical protein